MTEIRVPTLGESVTEATVATWFKKPGENVSTDEMICELETDKVTVEVPAPISGVLSEIIANEGETVAVNALLAVLTAKSNNLTSKTQQKSDNDNQENGLKTDKSHKDLSVEVAPSAKKAIVEAGIAQDEITGSGRDGRIMKEDVKNAILSREQNQSLEKVARVSIPVASKSTNQNINTREERIKMSRLRQTIAKRLKDSQNTAAMLTTYNEVDMTAVIDLRQEYKELFQQKHGVRLGFLSFFTKACCQALKEIPEVNAEIDEDEIVYKNYVNMGIATGTPTGLVVPVIRNVDELSFSEIEKQIAEKGLQARDGNLSMADMQDGTFTISNGGVYGSLMSSPILNPPQSGILGMHKIQDRPIAINGEIVIRPMMYLALSYDHRIVDGKGAVTFLVRVKEALEDPRRLLMDL
ncbi:MAG: 2-oxoglutarate dehydrogenase complex dihydrolipoyllysine-residue succinyltransferase [Paracoccaceae bacterium]|nr:2-oxoglutarate dehydrogenase complex dihydrolipoyllysine-residue succinyltransferase [Paracoccaceae bacterium]